MSIRLKSQEIESKYRVVAQKESRRWVVKMGSSLLTCPDGAVNQAFIQELSFQVATLRDQGVEIVLVASGSVSVGKGTLGSPACAEDSTTRRAAASLGQASLLAAFHECFRATGRSCGQLLVNKGDLHGRKAKNQLRDAIQHLLDAGAVPLLNENDATTPRTSLLGNNDLLAATIARLWGADLVVLLTDQRGLHLSDPRKDPQAPMISWGYASDNRYRMMAELGKGDLGTGGMMTKIMAAQNAAGLGIPTIITLGREKQILLQLRRGRKLGTLLLPRQYRLRLAKGLFNTWRLTSPTLPLQAWA